MWRNFFFARENLFPLGLLGIALALLAVSAFAGNDAQARAANRSLDDEALEIGKELQCPICQNFAVAYSPSPLAAQMRQIIRDKLQAGETRDQIIQYFVDRYGEGILWDPPKYGWNLIAWRLPVLALIAGAVGLLLLLKSWTHARDPYFNSETAPAEVGETNEYDALLDAELERRTREMWE